MLETGISLTIRNLAVQWMTLKLLQPCNYVYYKEDKQEANGVYDHCLTCEQEGHCVERALSML